MQSSFPAQRAIAVIKLVQALFAAGFALTAGGAEPSKPPVFQMRLVVDAASPDAEEMTLIRRNRPGGESRELLYVQKRTLMDETSLKSATVVTDARTGDSEIEIGFTRAGQQRLAEVTGQNIGKRLAIIIDGRLYSVPVIRSVISGGKAMISAKFTREEAADLAAKISAAIGK